ncbi:hypothetical protein H1D32_13400 [Anaerobacillus sp. CMMVII]|uniref:hypothetical protein n=1 Tax=Anaerobacillus sp. CMMVII TaxID=2755588 RepID=UPI0021B7EF98|nr:hypothetical protein [Anaerobacillus sp. CMMVII]MCT8138650.1 hypothetical protein [Anaerobacillus sp. CMMVII]
MVLEDSKILIDQSKQLLHEIEHIYEQDIRIGVDSPLLRVKIKLYLENINSALDYTAYKIFLEYCANAIKEREPDKYSFREGRVYFPCLEEKSKFDNYINDRFKYLSAEKEEIIDILAKYQPFPLRSKWLKYLKELVNNNKHRYLSVHSCQTHTHFDNLIMPGGAQFRNLTIVTEGDSVPIAYGDQPIDFQNPNTIPEGTVFKGSVEKDFYFKEIDQPVLKTLKRIYRSAPTVINDIEKLL